MKEIEINERRRLLIAPTIKDAIDFCLKDFQESCMKAIQEHGFFSVALSGGSTPRAVYEAMSKSEEIRALPWDKILLFWSDERAVPATDPDSNYGMAMKFFSKEPFSKAQVFRMKAEVENREHEAQEYQRLIKSNCFQGHLDLVYLGIGEDGHTASLFPKTHALLEKDALVVANYIPEKSTFRMTFTYPLINSSKKILFLVLGKQKAPILKRILTSREDLSLPSTLVGTKASPAYFLCDQGAASEMSLYLEKTIQL